MWEYSTDEILLPMLRHSDSGSSTFSSDDSKVEQDIEEEYFEPNPEADVNGVIFESYLDPRDPVAKKQRKIMPK